LSSILAERRARVRHVIAHRLLERRDDRGWSGRRRSWTDDLLWHHGGHVIDAVLQVLADDPVTGVSAVAADAVRDGARPTEYAISLRTAGGAIATIALSYGSRLEVADLMVLTDVEAWHVSGAELRSSTGWIARGSVAETQAQAIRDQDAAFVAACLGGATFPASAARILPTLRVQQRVANLVAADGK
jgi:2-hydroxy-4-carboxymuconate semialdehyde hemiacetal dehydrogenase